MLYVDSGNITKENAAFIVEACNSHYQLVADRAELVDALQAIAGLNGNLPLESLDGKCGPNDGASRGIRLRAAIETAQRALLTRMEATPKQEQQ